MKFRLFIPIDDDEIIEKIHMNYRLGYLRDTALATGLDESNLQTISNLINNNNQELVQNILLNQENINLIFERLRNDDIELRKEAISFLSELFSLSKGLQMQGRLNLMSSFKNIGDFNLLIFVKESISFHQDYSSQEDVEPSKLLETERIVSNSIDILMSYLQSFLVTISELSKTQQNTETEDLLKCLTNHMLNTPSQGIKLQIHELLRYILESKDISINKMFYETGLQLISDFFETEYKPDDSEYNTSIGNKLPSLLLGQKFRFEIYTFAYNDICVSNLCI